jgi:NAD kinase
MPFFPLISFFSGSRHTVVLSLDLSVNGQFLTRLSGDGLIVATATGSTGYSLSGGGSVCAHPFRSAFPSSHEVFVDDLP